MAQDDFATLNLRIRNNQFNRGVDQSMGKLGGLSGVATKAGIALASVFAVRTVFRTGKQLVNLASTAEETRSKFAVVFDEMGATAEHMANRFAKSFDITGTQARRLLGDTGDLLTGFGFTDDQALQLSTDMNELAGDLASFTNIQGGTAKASEALTKLLLGETEQAKALGIVVRQGSDEYKDLVESIMDTQGASLLQAKALASLQLAQEQSKNALGDYERTQDSTANSLKRASNAWEDLQEKIGKLVIEGGAVAGLMDDITGWIRTATDAIERNGDSWIFMFRVALIEMQFFGKKIASFVDLFIIQNWGNMFNWLMENWHKMFMNFGDIALAFGKDLTNWMLIPWNTAFSFINDWLGLVGEMWVAGFTAIIDFAINAFENLFEFIKSGGTTDLFGNLADDFSRNIDNVLIQASDRFGTLGTDAKNSFIDGIAGIGSETEKALERAGVTKLDIKNFDDLIDSFEDIDKAKAQALKDLFEDTQRRVGTPETAQGAGGGPGDGPGGAVGASATAMIESAVTDAIEKGSLEAVRLEATQVTKEDKIVSNTKKTAENTKEMVEEIKKTNKSGTKQTIEVVDATRD